MKRPNIVIIMTDDQGYGDLSCMGTTDFVTPNLDGLAAEGARFTSWYSNSPVCSPSRASLLTGRYPGNAGVREILAGSRTSPGITDKTPTIASAVKKLGYDTSIIGKWHLGLAEKSRPNQNGFDSFYGFMAGCIDYYSHIFYWGGNSVPPIHDLWDNDQEIFQNGEYFTELVTDKSVEYIREKAGQEKPFLLYTAYNAPHYPMHAPQKYMDRFKHLPWDRQIMAAMISAVDDGVGEIVNELKRNGIYEDTLIFFQSDNGPSRESRNWMDGNPDYYYGGTAGILKGHKFSLFEGGIRVPAIMSYPAVIPKGQVIDEPCAAMDVFPTILNLLGADASEYDLDGLDIRSVLCEQDKSPHEYIFWEAGAQTAVRWGNYKLVLKGQTVEMEPPVEEEFLSDLSVDISERNNLKDKHPEILKQLKEAALAWRNDIEERWEVQE